MGPVNPIDDPAVDGAVFFPRPDLPFGPEDPGARDRLFEVEPGVNLRLRVFAGPRDAPTILFFHGNGETGRDYDAIAGPYNLLPATFVVAEYRGYGPCGGSPGLSTFLSDAHASLDETRALLDEEQRPWHKDARKAEHRVVLAMPLTMKQLRGVLAKLLAPKTST